MESVELLDCSNLAPGSLIDVETKSRHYQIECLGGTSVRISGHPEYCPAPVPALLYGSVDRGGGMEFGMIGCGRRLMFFLDGQQPVTTSRVVHVKIETPKAPSARVH